MPSRSGSTSSSLYIGMTTDNSGTMRSSVRPSMGCGCHVTVPRLCPSRCDGGRVRGVTEPSAQHPPGRGMPPGGLAPGTPVAARSTKWGGGAHRAWVGTYLGADEHGHWWYSPAGTRCRTPAGEYFAASSWVSLAPHAGAYAVGFSPAHREVSVYVDMKTAP